MRITVGDDAVRGTSSSMVYESVGVDLGDSVAAEQGRYEQLLELGIAAARHGEGDHVFAESLESGPPTWWAMIASSLVNDVRGGSGDLRARELARHYGNEQHQAELVALVFHLTRAAGKPLPWYRRLATEPMAARARRQRTAMRPLHPFLPIPEAAVEAAVAFWTEQAASDRPHTQGRHGSALEAAIKAGPPPVPTREQLVAFGVELRAQIRWQVYTDWRQLSSAELDRIWLDTSHGQRGVRIGSDWKGGLNDALDRALSSSEIHRLRLPTWTETSITAFYTSVRARDHLAGRPLWLNEAVPKPTCQEFAEHGRCALAVFHDGGHRDGAADADALMAT